MCSCSHIFMHYWTCVAKDVNLKKNLPADIVYSLCKVCIHFFLMTFLKLFFSLSWLEIILQSVLLLACFFISLIQLLRCRIFLLDFILVDLNGIPPLWVEKQICFLMVSYKLYFLLLPAWGSLISTAAMQHTCKIATLQFDMFPVKTCLSTGML